MVKLNAEMGSGGGGPVVLQAGTSFNKKVPSFSLIRLHKNFFGDVYSSTHPHPYQVLYWIFLQLLQL